MNPDKLIQIIALLADAHDFSLAAITLEYETEDGRVAFHTYEAAEAEFDA